MEAIVPAIKYIFVVGITDVRSKEKLMEAIVPAIKYIFVVGFGVEIILILRALFNLAREKARAAEAPAQPAEE
jgi:hypothetical protein